MNNRIWYHLLLLTPLYVICTYQIWKNENIQKSNCYLNRPLHFFWSASRMYPLLHEQLYPPSLLLHVWSHSSVFCVHSSISVMKFILHYYGLFISIKVFTRIINVFWINLRSYYKWTVNVDPNILHHYANPCFLCVNCFRLHRWHIQTLNL